IINSSGSMVYNYQKDTKLTTNQLLILCGTLHSLGCMIQEINNKSSHVFYFNYTTKIITFYKTATDLSFIIISDKKQAEIINKIHKDFCKYIMLNPFYILDMPIHCKKFDPTKYFNSN
ncbi:hypothetical protein NCER_100982, partial [Vairimorpha ceranae BRL01]